MPTQFDTVKVIFHVTNAEVEISKRPVKLYLDYDTSLPLGRVWFSKKGNKIYGRIKYYTNLEAYHKSVGRLGTSYPAVELALVDGKAVIKNAYISLFPLPSDANKIECLGKQILRRKLSALGILCYRDSSILIWATPPNPREDFTAMVFSGTVTPDFTILAELLIENSTRTPISIKYQHPRDHSLDLFYLNEL